MGVPAPMHAGAAGGRWEPDDISGFFTRREWFYNPLTSSTVKVMAEHHGRTVERYVAVLSLGPLPDITWPESGRDPWMLVSDKLGFPVEWSMAGAMLDPKELTSAIEFEQNRAAGISAHYNEHNLIPPPAVERAIEGATLNLDEVAEGDTRTAVRFLGPIRLATYAATEAECLEQARALVDAYGERLNFELAHPRGQAQLLREFVPGEPWSTVGYQRRLPAKYLASAMPHVDAEVGTPTGSYLGYGIGSARRAVRFDPHYGPEKLQQPGLFTITAEPGGGKSVLIGALAYNAARRGEPTIILDPSGPLAKLCELPELRPYARRLDLTASSPGTLSPYQLIPEPHAAAHLDAKGRFNELDFERAKRIAIAERQQLMFDVLRMWLPLGLLREVGTDVKLRSAIRNTRVRVVEKGLTDVQTNPRWVVEALTELPHTENLVAEIEAAAEFPLGELVIPDHADPIPTEHVGGQDVGGGDHAGAGTAARGPGPRTVGVDGALYPAAAPPGGVLHFPFHLRPQPQPAQERLPRREPPDGHLGIGPGVDGAAVPGQPQVGHRGRCGLAAPRRRTDGRPDRRTARVGVRRPADQAERCREGLRSAAVPAVLRAGDPGAQPQTAGRQPPRHRPPGRGPGHR